MVDIPSLARKLSPEVQEGVAAFVERVKGLRPKQRRLLKLDYQRAVMFCGRGAGKSHAITTLIGSYLLFRPECKISVFGRTLKDAKSILMEGPAGLGRLLPMRDGAFEFNRGNGEGVWKPNGARVQLYGGSDADKPRGSECDLAVLDELPHYQQADEIYEEVQRTLRGRKDSTPRMVVASTPLFDELSRKVLNDADLYINAPTTENIVLPPSYVENIKSQITPAAYDLEVLGLIPDSVPNAVYPVEHFSGREYPVNQPKPGDVSVLSIDPSGASGTKGSNTGACWATLRDGEVYIRGSYEWTDHVEKWSETAIDIAIQQGCHVVIETNLCGEAFIKILRDVAKRQGLPTARIHGVRSTKSKIDRHQIAAALHCRGKLHVPAKMKNLRYRMTLLSREEEYVRLDKNRRDDTLDAMSQAVTYLRKNVVKAAAKIVAR